MTEATPATENPEYAAVREKAIAAAMAIFDRDLRLMAPPRHLVVEALDAAAGVVDADQEAAAERMVAATGLVSMEALPDHGVRLRIALGLELTMTMLGSFKDLLDANPAAINYIEQHFESRETGQQYVVIVVRPGGKTPHQLQQEAAQRADSLAAELGRIRAAGVDPRLLRWCSWPGCFASFDASSGPEGGGWKQYRHMAVLLCPEHQGTDHWPTFETDRTDLAFLVARCGCGAAEKVRPSNREAVFAWWERHLTDEGLALATGHTIRVVPSPMSGAPEGSLSWQCSCGHPDSPFSYGALILAISSALRHVPAGQSWNVVQDPALLSRA